MDDYKKIEEIKKKPEKNEIQIYMEEDTESETEEEDICFRNRVIKLDKRLDRIVEKTYPAIREMGGKIMRLEKTIDKLSKELEKKNREEKKPIRPINITNGNGNTTIHQPIINYGRRIFNENAPINTRENPIFISYKEGEYYVTENLITGKKLRVPANPTNQTRQSNINMNNIRRRQSIYEPQPIRSYSGIINPTGIIPMTIQPVTNPIPNPPIPMIINRDSNMKFIPIQNTLNLNLKEYPKEITKETIKEMNKKKEEPEITEIKVKEEPIEIEIEEIKEDS